MFAFGVAIDENDSDCRMPFLRVTSPNSTYKFMPEGRLPEYELLDVTSPRCELIFSKCDGYVSLKWDSTKVTITLHGDVASTTYEIGKTDNSLQDALTEWIKFEKEEALFDEEEKKINIDEKNALELVNKKRTEILLKNAFEEEEIKIRNSAELKKEQLRKTRDETMDQKANKRSKLY